MMTTGTLPHGFMYKGKLQKTFEMTAVETAGDLFDAELECGGIQNELAFNGALMARQLVRIGDCEGPFTLEQIRTLKPADFTALRIAQGKLSGGTGNEQEIEDESGT